MRNSIKITFMVSLAVAIATAGCSSPKRMTQANEGASTSTSTTPEIKTPAFIQGGVSVMPGINAIANLSDAMVYAEVLEVGPPRFNSIDGLPWGDPPRFGDSTIMPTVYRTATIEITKVVFSSERVPVAAGTKLEIRALGDGSVDDGDEFIFGSSGEDGVYYDTYDAMIQPGSSVLVMLYKYENIGVYGGDVESFVMPNPGYMGTWRIDGEMAVNIDPARTAPLNDLIRRILYERELGRTEVDRDTGTETNPLAGDQPPADWRPPEAAIPSP